MKINKTILTKALKVSEAAALKAGKKLLSYQKKLELLNITTKEAQGVVSEADVVAENIVIKTLKQAFPEADFLAEEACFINYSSTEEAIKQTCKSDWIWIIDPLDGTTNFLSGMDYFGVCISLTYKGQPVTGLVYRPTTGECFYASKGNGAYKKNLLKGGRGKPLLVKSNRKKLRESLLVTGFATEKGEMFDKEFSQFKHIMGKSRGIRRMGSAALDLCFVAEGIFDAFWERGLAPWDVAAAGLICLESGVKVTNYEGDKFNPFQKTILACRTPLYKELFALF